MADVNEKIRIGNDIDIRWSLVDGDGEPYILEGRNISIEIVVNSTKRVRIRQFEVSGNTMHFVYYGKDQKYLGPCDLKYIENDGQIDMVTFDTQAAFTMVPHSWLAVDPGEQPERVYLEYTSVASELIRIGGGYIDVDDHLSLESENPVQNKVVTEAINSKQDTLVSGENVKTINGQSILGRGDIEISGGSADARVEGEKLIITADNAAVEGEKLIIS